ncbi:MAG TPA: Clp protease N-terminal domain-containing protein [Candidatus Saccharimonadales bacterium]|nr:Clp protease N-terminal domain-containing protein [Candidatus Saccharimonadales bacterium]
MSQPFTQMARRVIFFAWYEARQYGSPYIESEHFLLGLLREDLGLVRRFLGPNAVTTDIRAEIEKQIPRREPISASVEIPLSAECKKILNLAVEESDSLAHEWVGTEHILLGILTVKDSLAAGLLQKRGLETQAIRKVLAKTPASDSLKELARPSREAKEALDHFLAGLKWHDWEQLAPFFAQNTHFVDSSGKRWIGREEIEKQLATIFAPYAKKNVTFLLEGMYSGPAESVVASVLWENVTSRGEPTRSLHRMTVILAQERDDWAIFLVQVTPVAAN